MIGATASPAAAIGGAPGERQEWHNRWDVTFASGIPVGGWIDTVTRSDGNFQFQGHIHDSGFTSYDFTAVWILTPTSGSAAPVGFEAQDHMAGTMESGSRDIDWNQSGVAPRIVDLFQSGFKPTGNARTTLDIGAILQDVGVAVAAVQWAVKMF